MVTDLIDKEPNETLRSSLWFYFMLQKFDQVLEVKASEFIKTTPSPRRQNAVYLQPWSKLIYTATAYLYKYLRSPYFLWGVIKHSMMCGGRTNSSWRRFNQTFKLILKIPCMGTGLMPTQQQDSDMVEKTWI